MASSEAHSRRARPSAARRRPHGPACRAADALRPVRRVLEIGMERAGISQRHRRAALRLGPGRTRRAGRLERAGAWAPVSRLHDPLLRPRHRRMAVYLDRTAERARAALHRLSTGDDIVLLSDEDDPQLRWSFSDITPGSFRGAGRSPTTAARRGSSTSRCSPLGRLRVLEHPGAPPGREVVVPYLSG